MSLIQCSILLLAGGRGQRMGGQDKGLVTWQGQPLIAYAQRVARPLTDDLIISCNRNPDQYARFADQLVSDGNDDFAGPLAGDPRRAGCGPPCTPAGVALRRAQY